MAQSISSVSVLFTPRNLIEEPNRYVFAAKVRVRVEVGLKVRVKGRLGLGWG